MPRDINGNFSVVPGTIVSSGDTILPSQHNPMANDFAAGLTNSLSRTGLGGMLANLSMGGFDITSVGTLTAVNLSTAALAVSANATVGGTLNVTGRVGAPAGFQIDSSAVWGINASNPFLQWDTGGDFIVFNRSNDTLFFNIASATKMYVAPTEVRFNVAARRDAQFYLDLSGNNVVINFDANDYITYDRPNNKYLFSIGGFTVASIDASGVLRTLGAVIPNTTP